MMRGACFACRQPGHMASQCPRRTTQTHRHMEEVRMKIKRITPDAKIPQTQTKGAIAGPTRRRKVVIPTKQRKVVPTDTAAKIPGGHYLLIQPIRNEQKEDSISVPASSILTTAERSKLSSLTTRPTISRSKNTNVLRKQFWRKRRYQLSKKRRNWKN